MNQAESSTLIRPFADQDEQAVIQLWQDCGLLTPANDPHLDIERKRQVHRELFLVAVEGERIIGTVMAGYEGHRGWINYLAVSPQRRRIGLGRELMAQAEQRLRALGCPKINLQVRATNEAVRAFYEKIGFSEDRVVSFGKRLLEDRP